ncbi:MAG: C69 family dipeptidase [Candidatus Helarchaeota archaeon]
MCDTIVACKNSTEDGSVLFGKNSDRDPGEVHTICYIPRGQYEEGETIQCQYISVPQVTETFAVILAKPVWLSIGCEMGANEFGVVMGNEAVFTKEKYERDALLGMELMTLALQRAKTARKALNVITQLITDFGQGGIASLKDPNYIYHNSFIIADPNEAWVLETAGKFWVAKKVEDVASISNGLTIQDNWDIASPHLVDHAINMGWCESKSDFNFTECYSDQDMRAISGCIPRQATTLNKLKEQKGQITPETFMKLLRTHAKEPFRPDKSTMASVCLHYSSQAVSQTTGSYVAHLDSTLQTHWLTGTSAPCLSIFKPFFFEAPTPLIEFLPPSLKNDNSSLWWKHERLYRLCLLDYPTRAPIIIQKNFVVERQLLEKWNSLKTPSPQFTPAEFHRQLSELSATALNANFNLLEKLTHTIATLEIAKPPKKSFIKFWQKLSASDRLDNIYNNL